MFDFFSAIFINIAAWMSRIPSLNNCLVFKYQLQTSTFHQTCWKSDHSVCLLLQVPTSQKKEGVYDVPKSQPVSVSIFIIYMQGRRYVS